MALPNNNIYPALIANTIGEPSTDIGTLVLSNKVNRWGFNSPDPVQQAKYWGVVNPPPFHELGAFRGYDHYWRCYALGEIEIGGDINLYNPGFLGLNIIALAGLTESPAYQSVPHVFDVWMNRWAIDWNPLNGAVLIAEDFTIYEGGHQKIDIDPLSPPDGFGALPYNHPIYFSLRHKSSPAKRWDSRAWSAQDLGALGSIAKDPNGNYDGWTITIVINEPI